MTLLDSRGQPLVRSSNWALTRPNPEALPPYFTFNGNTYPLGMSTTMHGNKEEMDGSYSSFAWSAYLSNPVVFTCMRLRQSLFSQVRFAFQQLRDGRPGDLFSTPALGILNEEPSPGETTGDLLARTIMHADLAGSAFVIKRDGEFVNLRPDWVTLVIGSRQNPVASGNASDAKFLGIVFHPGGRNSGEQVETYLAEEVGHFAPFKHPFFKFRGVSWLAALTREIQGDLAASDYKTAYYVNGATPNLAVTFDASIKREAFDAWIKAFESNHVGVANAYKTMYLGAGATVTPIGSTFQDSEFKAIQGASETRIVSAAGLHPTMVGLSEGLQGSSLNEGNFTAAARLTAHATFRYLWGQFAGAMQSLIPPPSGSRIWYDERSVPFLREDAKDRVANAKTVQETITSYVREGFTAKSAIAAVMADDPRELVHTGLTSVQLHDPSEKPEPPPVATVLPPEEPKQLTAGPKRSADPEPIRCAGCDKLLAELASAPYRMTCPRCKAVTSAGIEAEVEIIEHRAVEPDEAMVA